MCSIADLYGMFPPCVSQFSNMFILQISELGYHLKHFPDIGISINSVPQCCLQLANYNQQSFDSKFVFALQHYLCTLRFIKSPAALARSSND